MKKSIIIFIILFITSAANAQILKIGFRVEPNILFTEADNSSSVLLAFYNVSLSAIVTPIEKVNIEVRPGYILGGEDYMGTELGLFLKINALSKLLLIAGLNSHSNNGSGHNSGGSYHKNIIYTGVGVGLKVDSRLSVDVMYYWTSDKSFAYYHTTDWQTYSRIIERNMNGIIKVGFCFTWDIF